MARYKKGDIVNLKGSNLFGAVKGMKKEYNKSGNKINVYQVKHLKGRIKGMTKSSKGKVFQVTSKDLKKLNTTQIVNKLILNKR